MYTCCRHYRYSLAPKLNFNDFELDVSAYELRRKGRPVKVERTARVNDFETLRNGD